MQTSIRKMRSGDLEAIYKLNKNDLGYDYDIKEMKQAWDIISDNKQNIVLVALDCEEVIGYIHVGRYELLCQKPMASIFTLAVSSSYQQQGIGKKLIEAAEKWAKKNDCAGVRVLSNEKREQAHLFYKSCGYNKTKVQINFKKYF